MVTKSKNSSSTLMYLLDGKIGQGFYDEISDNVKKGSGELFKDSLRRYFIYFAESISSSVIAPKLSSVEFIDIISYLCFYIGQYPELFGRMKVYFGDEEYYSFNVGIKLFNDFIERMCKALDEPRLSKFYLRLNVDNDIKPVVDKKYLFDMEVFFSSPSIGKLINKDTVSSKVNIYIKNISDKKSVFSLTLFDYVNNAKSSPIIVNPKGDKVIKSLSVDIPYSSLLPNGLARLGLLCETKTHIVDIKGKKKNLKLEYNKVELKISPYLRIIK